MKILILTIDWIFALLFLAVAVYMMDYKDTALLSLFLSLLLAININYINREVNV